MRANTPHTTQLHTQNKVMSPVHKSTRKKINANTRAHTHTPNTNNENLPAKYLHTIIIAGFLQRSHLQKKKRCKH